MKIYKIEKSYSWLQWPVTLKNWQDPKLHITAKFFGNALIDPEWVEVRLGRYHFEGKWNDSFQWRPDIFHDLMHVFKFTRFPDAMKEVHSLFGLVKDQFDPWQPHVTVPKAYWSLAQLKKWSPKSEEMTLGEFQLFLGTGGE